MLALGSGVAVTVRPALFPLVLFLDLWMLGYHHVVATFTRFAFDRSSFRRHRFLAAGLPALVAAGVGLVLAVWGVAGVTTAYFYGQWYHYLRQSHGLERAYARKGGGGRFAPWVLHLTAAAGLLVRCAQAPPTFLGLTVYWLPVPAAVAWITGAAAVAAIVAWLAAGRGSAAHSLYVVTHVAVFAAGYVLIDDVTHGWLVVNVWHNAQYLLFVWLYHANRFRDGVDPEHPRLSALAQPRNAPLYVLVCLALTAALYLPLQVWGNDVWLGGAPLALVAFQWLNFHHYAADARLWKLRDPVVRRHLGLTAEGVGAA